MSPTRAVMLAVGLTTMALAGCSGGSAGQGGPGMGQLSADRCKQVRAETSKLEARGVQQLADRAGRGEIALKPSQRADVDRYNSLLDQYLGGRCHL